MTDIAYDEIKYPYSIRPATHVSRLAAAARLLGRDAPPVECCNVLEIGGGNAINLVSMALGLPEARFLSVDISEQAVKDGQELLRVTGVTNVACKAVDLRDIPDSAGPFDYVIAHGVYAWVPGEVREAILALLGRLLSPKGVAMVSYNAQPGCRPRQVIRDLLLRATRGITDRQRRIEVARKTLEFYIGLWDTKKAFPATLNDEARLLMLRPEAVMFHDEMGAQYNPQLLTDVVADAARYGLAYLGDTQLGLLSDAFFPGDLFEKCLPLSEGDFIEFEQIRDFIEVRSFRQTLLCRAGGPINRGFEASRLTDLHVDGRLERIFSADLKEDEYIFKTLHGGEFSTRNQSFAESLIHLAEIFPASEPVASLSEDPETLEALTNVFLMGGVEFMTAPFPVKATLDDRPRGSRLARAEVAFGLKEVSSLRHTYVSLDESGVRFLERLDGTKDAAQLAADMAPILGLTLEEARARVHKGLADFNRLGLIES